MTIAFWNELRLALRSLRRSRGFLIFSVLIFALGIGANTVIFEVVDAVLLRPLPYRDPARLVKLTCDAPGTSMSDIGLSVPELEDLRRRKDIFEEFSAVWPMDGNLTGADRPTHIDAMAVSDNYFRLLGTNPFKGRLFIPDDGIPWMSVNSVISYGAWVRLFGSDPNVLGRRVKLDYDDYVVIGVLPPTFHHPGLTLQGEPDFYLTGSFRGGAFPQTPARGLRMIPSAIGRLKEGLSLEQAQSRLGDFARNIRSEYPRDYPEAANWTPRIARLQSSLAGGSRSMLLIMSGAALTVLLICCTTIANLFLARASEKRREIAIRIAIGAKPVNVVRQLVMECLLLAGAGSILGLMIAVWGTPLFVRWAPFPLPHINDFTLNRATLLYTTVACVSMAVLGSLLPALYSLRLNLAGVMREAGSGPDGSRFGNRSRSALVVCQIAISIMLMSGAGLLVKTMWNLLQIDPGFNARNLLVGSIWLPPPGNPAARKYETQNARSLFADRLLRQLNATPGVQSAALGTGDAIPLVGWNSNQFHVEGLAAADGRPYFGQVTGISEDYLSTVGAHLDYGRNFNTQDRTSPGVALVNRTLAERIWKGQSPIGRKIGLGSGDSLRWYEIVGVTSDVKSQGYDAPLSPHIYVPLFLRSGYALSVMVRTKVNPESEAEVLGHVVTSVDSDLTVFATRSMEEVVGRSLGPRRFALLMIGGFGLIAVILALTGVYAITAFLVSQKKREIGIRIALGASRGSVLKLIVKRGMTLTLVGIGAGLAGALLLAGSLKSILFGVSTTDVVPYLSVAILLACSALLACYIPARIAASMNPASTIRNE